MKTFSVLILAILIMARCGKNGAAENRVNDTVPITDSVHATVMLDNKESTTKTTDDQFDYSVDSEQVDPSQVDTATTQVISTSCVIMTMETASQTAWREAEEVRLRAEDEAAARKSWESQPHDSAEVFEYYPGYEGDADYYQSESSRILSELKISTVVIEEKDFVLLKKKNGEALWVNVRDGFTPDWDMILFHVEKEPVRLDMMSVSKEQLQKYFFQ